MNPPPINWQTPHGKIGDAMLNIVLVNPEIPPNTGNIGRICVATRGTLHLIKPLGFKIDDRSLKRAGLDYWQHLDLKLWPDLQTYLGEVAHDKIVLTSSKRGTAYHEVKYATDDHILFGPETTGLSPELFRRFPSRVARIPMDHGKVRSLNLAVSVGIIVFEALKQTGNLL
ncbi:tRNA (cytidine(34)-2'-O)-methyltransferase [Thermodesulfobacteriota bacterium]